MQNQQITSKAINDSDRNPKYENSGFFSVLIATFTTIFFAELGDKTQVATLLLAAQSGKPIIVFIGSATALILSSLMGVILGKWLSSKLAPETFEYLAGGVMVVIGLTIAIEAAYSIFFK